MTWAASPGAPMVATALVSGIAAAAESTAAPPSEWPTRMSGARRFSLSQSAAVRRSATFEEKLVDANSPSDDPSPVKSKRSTAIPRAASSLAMVRAAKMSFEQVKQWANSAAAATSPAGRSSRAASRAPDAPANSTFPPSTVAIACLPARRPGTA